LYEQKQLRTAGVPEARQKRDEKELTVEEGKSQIKKKKTGLPAETQTGQ